MNKDRYVKAKRQFAKYQSKFFRTSNDFVTYDGHRFFQTTGFSASTKSKIWKCATNGCPSQLYTNLSGDKVMRLSRKHNHASSDDEVDAEVPTRTSTRKRRGRPSSRRNTEAYEEPQPTDDPINGFEDDIVEDVIRYQEDSRNSVVDHSRNPFQDENWEIKVTSSQEPVDVASPQPVSTVNTGPINCSVVSQIQPSTSSGQNDDLHGFFINILTDVNSFQPQERLKFKKRILDVIIQIYDERTTDSQNPTLERSPVQVFQTQAPRERQLTPPLPPRERAQPPQPPPSRERVQPQPSSSRERAQPPQLSPSSRERAQPPQQSPSSRERAQPPSQPAAPERPVTGKERKNNPNLRQSSGMKSVPNINVFVTYGNNDNEGGASYNEDRTGPRITCIPNNSINCEGPVIDLEKVKEEC